MVKRALVVLLGLNTVAQSAVAGSLLLAARDAVPAVFSVPYTADNRQVVATMGVAVLASALLLALSVYWVIRNDVAGAYAGSLFGLWSVAAGLVLLVQFGKPGAWFDLGRGALIIGTALLWSGSRRRSGHTVAT